MLTQDTIDSLRAALERIQALGQILADVTGSQDVATVANDVTALVDDATDALAVEPVQPKP